MKLGKSYIQKKITRNHHMSTEQKIKCPKCNTSISIDTVLTHQIEEKIKKEFGEANRLKEAEIVEQKRELEDQRSKLEEIQKKQAMESRQQFMEDYADLHGFYSACTDPRLPRTDSDEPFTDEKKATLRELRRVDFEKQFIELKIRSRVAAQGIPSPKIPLPECSPVSAKQIGGQTPQVAAAA